MSNPKRNIFYKINSSTATLFPVLVFIWAGVLVVLALVCGRVNYALRPILPPVELPAEVAFVKLSIAETLPEVLWVDARKKAEFDAGHIPGAVNLTLEGWAGELGPVVDLWQARRPVVVYCGEGGCSLGKEVAAKLKKSVPTMEVKILKGGYESWLAR